MLAFQKSVLIALRNRENIYFIVASCIWLLYEMYCPVCHWHCVVRMKTTKNRSLNYKICGLPLMKDNTWCFDKLSDCHGKLNSPPKHFSVVELHLCSSKTVYKLCDMIKYTTARLGKMKQILKLFVWPREVWLEQTISSPLLHAVAARLWDENRVKYCCGLCLCLQMCIGYQHSDNSVNMGYLRKLATRT
jgi:hypothetical protein